MTIDEHSCCYMMGFYSVCDENNNCVIAKPTMGLPSIHITSCDVRSEKGRLPVTGSCAERGKTFGWFSASIRVGHEYSNFLSIAASMPPSTDASDYNTLSNQSE